MANTMRMGYQDLNSINRYLEYASRFLQIGLILICEVLQQNLFYR